MFSTWVAVIACVPSTFPGGTPALSAAEFLRYVRELRPDEADVASRFFLHNLNRTSISVLKESASKAGLGPITVVAFPDDQYFSLLERDTLTSVQRHYPTVSLLDLVSRSVWVVYRRS